MKRIIVCTAATLMLAGPSVVAAQGVVVVGPTCPEDPEELQRVCREPNVLLPFPDCCDGVNPPRELEENETVDDETEHGGGANSEREDDGQIINPRIRETIERLVNERFESAILMTDQDCAVFGDAWELYNPARGRFPLASGSGTDDRDETVEPFQIGDRGGEYQHVLTEPEMPSHVHTYEDKYLDNRESENANRGDDDDEERRYGRDARNTGVAGQTQPHNNMPPYLVLNFCHNVERDHAN
ncbi:MAG: hypothetical protein F4X97_07060 [Boseongicola sp. SB0662_bin_57]|nr:hypothetical protein [Boseongicola sp. SB0662_bin_57]